MVWTRNIGGDAGEYDVLDPAQAQHQFEVGGTERTLAGLVDDYLAAAGPGYPLLVAAAMAWFRLFYRSARPRYVFPAMKAPFPHVSARWRSTEEYANLAEGVSAKSYSTGFRYRPIEHDEIGIDSPILVRRVPHACATIAAPNMGKEMGKPSDLTGGIWRARSGV
jgi:hypothetical protein